MAERIALAVDDVSANRDFLERLLTGAQFKVLGAFSGGNALKVSADLKELALAVVDINLPDMTGLELSTQLRARFPEAYLVVATVMDERSVMEAAFAVGCNAFLVKPHGFMELFKRLTSSSTDELRASPQVIIDQYGPRQFKISTQNMQKIEIPKDTTESS